MFSIFLVFSWYINVLYATLTEWKVEFTLFIIHILVTASLSPMQNKKTVMAF